MQIERSADSAVEMAVEVSDAYIREKTAEALEKVEAMVDGEDICQNASDVRKAVANANLWLSFSDTGSSPIEGLSVRYRISKGNYSLGVYRVSLENGEEKRF